MKRLSFLNVLLLLASWCNAQEPDTSFWDTNGTVRCFATKGDTLFVGGDFTHVGPFTGGLISVDTITGATVPFFGIVDGDVNAVISDGAGGWYVGGSARVDTMFWCGPPMAFVRHILPDRSVDPAIQVNGALYTNVTDLALWQGELIIAGDIDTLNGLPFQNLLRMDTATAALIAMPNTPSQRVNDVELVGDVLFLAGYFDMIGTESRNSLGSIDLSDGSVHSWHPIVDGSANCLAVTGDTMHISGDFFAGSLMGTAHMLIADLIFGDTMLHPIQPNSAVNELITAGDTLLIGGDFTELSGLVRKGLGAVDIITLSLLPLSLDIGGRVNTIISTPERIFLGGLFNNVGTEPRHHVASIERSSGNLTPWKPKAGGYVSAIASMGQDVLIGGRFHIANGGVRNGLCAFRMSTGELLPWSPDLGEIGWLSNNQRVSDMDIVGNTLYIGGNFDSAEGLQRLNAAAYDITTGTVTPWDPQVDGAYVKALKAHDGSVYLGGTFWNVGGQSRSRIAAVNATDGIVTNWNPITSTTFYVNDIQMWADTVVVGGIFGDMGGAARRGLAALHPSTGLALEYDYTDPNDPISTSCLLIRGNDVLVGGAFDTIFGASSYFGLLGYHLDQDHSHINWNPLVEGRVSAIAEQGNVIYLGGVVTSINGSSNEYHPAVAVDTASGLFTPSWLPDFGSICAEVMAIKATPSKIFLGAKANNLTGSSRRFFMAVDPPIDVSLQERPTVQGLIKIWPNPANGQFTIAFSGRQGIAWSATVSDAFGRVVLRSEQTTGAQLEFQCLGLPSGVYSVGIQTIGGYLFGTRLVLQKQ